MNTKFSEISITGGDVSREGGEPEPQTSPM